MGGEPTLKGRKEILLVDIECEEGADAAPAPRPRRSEKCERGVHSSE